jgi:UDP-N-acetylmuramoylalanine--D-glutamate ligase
MDLKNRRVTVMGLGSFGGGLGAVEFLVKQGARVTVTDLRSEDQLTESLNALAETPPYAWHLGGHQPADFTDTDLVVVNPAVPRDSHFLELAIQSGVPLSSEMNLFWEFNRGRVIGITGSNGKSTTTAMTHTILQSSGKRCWLGGNIGKSLLPYIEEIGPEDWVVLELSSFQLEDLDRLQKSPEIAIITNFSANHLDRHLTLDNYRRAKQTILRWQRTSDTAVLNQDDESVRDWPTQGRRLLFGLSDVGNEGLFAIAKNQCLIRSEGKEVQIPLQSWLTLPGFHNLQNALSAGCAALAAHCSAGAIQTGLQGYQALPHRLELVAEGNGRQFYNDSLATTPESAIVAIEAFERPLILFAGGYDKGSDLTKMARAIAEKPTKAVALMGATASRLADLLNQFDPGGRVTRRICPDFNDAWNWAISQSRTGDILLLSPGCASYDWFRNFADRGAQFRERAQDYVEQPRI